MLGWVYHTQKIKEALVKTSGALNIHLEYLNSKYTEK